MPQHTARTISSDGTPGRLKLNRIREHKEAGAGDWIEGVFVFNQHPRPKQTVRAHSPRIPEAVPQPLIGDSKQSGFLRYPQPQMQTSGPKYLMFR